MQCQRYEEQIVELHSVIAELSRKLDDGRETDELAADAIIEEDEEAAAAATTPETEDDDYDEVEALVDEEEVDLSSKAFERAMEGCHKETFLESSPEYSPKLLQRSRENEMILRQRLANCEAENEKLRTEVEKSEAAVKEKDSIIDQILTERDSLKRRLEDLKTTVEYREAVMDGEDRKDKSSSSSLANSRSSSERRSLRRRRNMRRDQSTDVNGSQASSEKNNSLPSQRSSTDRPQSSADLHPHRLSSGSNVESVFKLRETQLELERSNSRTEHLQSQNEVLSLTLEESKSMANRLHLALSKYESNNSALTLGLGYCDQMVEAYDILVALLETEAAILTAREHHGGHPGSTQEAKAWRNRKAAESVAKHLLVRSDGRGSYQRSDSGLGGIHGNTNGGVGGGGGHFDTTWEDSSGYSHTTSSNASTSSSVNNNFMPSGENSSALDSPSSTYFSGMRHQRGGGGDFHAGVCSKSEETKLRDYICQLKSARSSLSLVEVESVEDGNQNSLDSRRSTKSRDMEAAVINQELMAGKEEIADLKAKVYLLDKEKAGLNMTLSDRLNVEAVLRAHVQHLQEELGDLERSVQFNRSHLIPSSPEKHQQNGGREIQLKQRVDLLLSSLDKLTQNSDMRMKQNTDLIDDLKRANSTLSEALEKNKKKYSSKVRALEHRLIMAIHSVEQHGVTKSQEERASRSVSMDKSADALPHAHAPPPVRNTVKQFQVNNGSNVRSAIPKPVK